MSWSYGWHPYVSVAERRAKAARETAKLAKKTGRAASPVVLDGRKIATTFWGKAWCDNLEAYSDYENRLPRGRTYVRNGSVVDLQISKGNVSALVSGSELYRIQIKIKPLTPVLWKSIQTECAGKIDSLIELLQGKLSSAVMQIVTRPQKGLFPTPKEIDLDCSCPDWADLCKHVAASLYGVGAKLDQNPALLFLLRGVDPADLISKASAAEAVRQTAATTGAPSMSEAEVADVFGIELAPASAVSVPAVELPAATPPIVAPTRAPKRKPSVKPKAHRRLSPAIRARLVAAAKARWARVSRMAKQKGRKEVNHQKG
ncbi:MAG: SWIM zinc finger family protein [Limisphaerales bacterium]